jgi:hypothetical protein
MMLTKTVDWPRLTWAPGEDMKAVILEVTPDMADRKRQEALFERQRPMRPRNIERLAHEMERRNFVPGTSGYIAILPDGSERLLNANHTLEAIKKSGLPQVMAFVYRRVKDLDEAGRLYAAMDIHAVRTWGDTLRATAKGEAIPMAEKVLSAIGIIQDSMGQEHHQRSKLPSRLDRVDCLADYREAAELLWMAVHGGTAEATGMIKVAPVLGRSLPSRSKPRAGNRRSPVNSGKSWRVTMGCRAAPRSARCSTTFATCVYATAESPTATTSGGFRSGQRRWPGMRSSRTSRLTT